MTCEPEYTYYIIEALALLAVFIAVAVVAHKKRMAVWRVESQARTSERAAETASSWEKQ